MIFFLYGPDSYRRREKLRELTEAYKRKNEQIDLLDIDFDEESKGWMRARDFLNQPSMFTEKKVLVLKEVDSVPDTSEAKEWVKCLKNERETPHNFVFISNSGTPKKQFSFLVEKPVQSQEFSELEGQALVAFVDRSTSVLGISFSPDAKTYFLQFLRSRSERAWCAVHELEKVSLASLPKPITLQNIKKMVRAETREEVFMLARKLLGAQSLRERVVILEQGFLQNEAPAYLFNALAYQARGKDLLLLADYDISVKKGTLGYEEALLHFALRA